jgi:hypothetical protein
MTIKYPGNAGLARRLLIYKDVDIITYIELGDKGESSLTD